CWYSPRWWTSRFLRHPRGWPRGTSPRGKPPAKAAEKVLSSGPVSRVGRPLNDPALRLGDFLSQPVGGLHPVFLPAAGGSHLLAADGGVSGGGVLAAGGTPRPGGRFCLAGGLGAGYSYWRPPGPERPGHGGECLSVAAGGAADEEFFGVAPDDCGGGVG